MMQEGGLSLQKTYSPDIPDSAVMKTMPPMQGVGKSNAGGVWSLAGELRSYLPHYAPQNKTKHIKDCCVIEWYNV